MKTNAINSATRSRLHTQGFTLVELLVVMTIIGILAGMVMPQYARVIEKVHRTACSKNLGQVGLALHAYAQDNEGRYPFTGSATDSANKHFALMFPRWIKKEAVFVCRSAATRGYRADDVTDTSSAGGARGETLKAGENSYAYAFGLGGVNTDELPLVCDQLADTSVSAPRWAKQGLGSNHGEDGGNVLYMDNHVEFLLADAQGGWPSKKQKPQGIAAGKFCAAANAERSPDDQVVTQH